MRISDLCRSLKILFAHSAALISILKNKMARRANAVRLFFEWVLKSKSEARGFGFEVQLSLTKKGQYAVAYCLS